jgi:hypothetical protein
MGEPQIAGKRRPVSVGKRLQMFIATVIFNLLRSVGYCVVLCGGVVVAYQGFLWVRDGVWTQLELRTGLRALEISEPTLDWAGAQNILAWGLDTPISAILAMLGLLVVAFAVAYLEPLTFDSPSDPRYAASR